MSGAQEGRSERPAMEYGQPLAGLGSLSVTSETLAPCASFVVEGLDFDAGRREAVEEYAAVVLGEHPWI